MELRKYAGVDVGNGTVTVCILSRKPSDLRRYWQTEQPMNFEANRQSLDRLLALEFDRAILEPSGGHYSRIWAHHLRKSGREVRWVGHKVIAAYRQIHDLPNKNDWSDAIALACYGCEKWDIPGCFVDGDSTELRQLFQIYRFVNRQRSPWINRLRQQLAAEWPEVSGRSLDTSSWGQHSRNRIVHGLITGELSPKLQQSLLDSIGIGPGPITRALAEQLQGLTSLQTEIEQAIGELLEDAALLPYRAVLDRYGMPISTQAAFLSRVYPIEKFLKYGEPVIERVGDRRTKRNRSLASYKLAIGMGMVQYQSGALWGWKPGGPGEVRSALWLWIKMAIVINHANLPEALRPLRDYYEQCEAKGNQRIMRVARRAVEAIFYELLEALHPP